MHACICSAHRKHGSYIDLCVQQSVSVKASQFTALHMLDSHKLASDDSSSFARWLALHVN